MPYSDLSLACGCLPTTPHREIVQAAVDVGYRYVGLQVTRDDWNPNTTQEIASILSSSSIELLDVEVLFLSAGEANDDLYRAIDVGGELGAKFALTVTQDTDRERNYRRFEQLCDHAADRNVKVALEFMRFFPFGTLDEALDLLTNVGHPNAVLLLDTLHFYRCGYTLDDFERIDPAYLQYVQLCDAPAQPPGWENDALIEDALYLRAPLGSGMLDVAGWIEQLPSGIPLSIEMRSREVYEAYPEPVNRARAIFDTTKAFLERHELWTEA